MSRGLFIVRAALILLLLLTPQSSFALKTLSGTISTNTVLDTVGGRFYQVTGNVTINPTATLTIDPGVVLKFNIGTYMTVSGKLMANGGSTADSLIYFTSIRDDNAPAPLGDDTNGDGNSTVPAVGTGTTSILRTLPTTRAPSTTALCATAGVETRA